MATLKSYSSGLARTLEHLPQAVLIVDPALRITYANTCAPEYFNRAKEALIGTALTQLIDTKHRRELQHAALAISKNSATLAQQSFFFTIVQQPDHSRKFAHVTLAPLLTNSGETHIYLRFNQTPHETQMAMGIREQLALVSLSVNAIKALDMLEDSVVIYDQEWRYQFLNTAAWKVLKREKSEVLGKVVWELYPDLINSDFYTAAFRSMKQQTQMVVEEYYPFARNWYRTKLYPSPSSLVTQMQDVTEMIEARNINQQLTGTLEQAMQIYWSDANRSRRESKSKKESTRNT